MSASQSIPPGFEFEPLIDKATLRRELAVSRATADAIFRAVPVTAVPGLRKVLVKRQDVAEFLRRHTYDNAFPQVRP